MASGDQPFNIDGGSPQRSGTPLRGLGMALVVVSLAVLIIVWLRHSAQNGNAQQVSDDTRPRSLLFQGWGTPAVALVLTGQMHGYLQPCGCSEPQYGGLARRYNFLQTLKDKGWPLVAVDLGDLAAHSGPQDMLKFETTIKALDLLNYAAIGLGKNEFYLKLTDILGFKVNYKAAEPPFLVSSNLQDSHDLVRSWVIAEKGKVPVGVACLIGKSVLKELRKFPQVTFSDESNDKIVKRVLKEIAPKKPGVVVLLYHGTEEDAKACAAYCDTLHKNDDRIPRVDLILRLENEEEPSGVPQKVGDTMIVGIGHKSRYVGVVGAFPGAAPGTFELKYQLVSIGPEYETLKGKDAANPVLALMQKYAEEVKEGKYLSKFPRSKHPTQLAHEKAKYVGSDRCGSCHAHADKIWQGTRHHKAFAALVSAKRPSLRQFDGECVVCHTVGFEYLTGYADSKNSPERNVLLVNVGCESCHGPGSLHANNPNNANLYPLINPFKAKPGENAVAQKHRLNQLDKFCQKCHDIDNDVHWGKVPFAAKWKLVEHPTPRNGQAVSDGKEDNP